MSRENTGSWYAACRGSMCVGIKEGDTTSCGYFLHAADDARESLTGQICNLSKSWPWSAKLGGKFREDESEKASWDVLEERGGALGGASRRLGTWLVPHNPPVPLRCPDPRPTPQPAQDILRREATRRSPPLLIQPVAACCPTLGPLHTPHKHHAHLPRLHHSVISSLKNSRSHCWPCCRTCDVVAV